MPKIIFTPRKKGKIIFTPKKTTPKPRVPFKKARRTA